MITIIDEDNATVTVRDQEGNELVLPMESAEGFDAASRAWIRAGWDVKYVYSFTWLGRPLIQLPDDMFRFQEVFYRVRPDVIIETGVAHGGSLIFYASLFKAIGVPGRVIGIDVEIWPHNRKAIEEHELFDYITLVEGSSVAPETVAQVRDMLGADERVMVMLDANHTRDHVRAELEAYGPLVSPGSYIVAADGVMAQVAGGSRTQPDWLWNNPMRAAEDFVADNPDFIIEEPEFPFNEGLVQNRVTYWPKGFIRRLR